MSIGFLTTDLQVGEYSGNIVPGGCAYYRCFLPALVSGQRSRLGFLAWDGDKGFGIRETERTAIYGFRDIVLKLIMDRWTPAQIERAQALGQRIIVDVDDHYDGLTEANLAYEITHPEKNRRTNREHYQKVIMAADAVTVSTPFLYDWWSERRDNVHLVRNGVDLGMFERRKVLNRKPIIGWVGATGYRNNDLEQLADWLPAYLDKHDLMFHHSGHDPKFPSFSDLTQVPAERITTSPTVSIDEYGSLFTFDIGIVPLNDIPFNHAKSNIKGLEYTAAGIPFVASDLPEYRVLSDDGVGLLARTPDEWQQQLDALLDYKTRKRLAAQQYTQVSRHWTYVSRTQDWQNVFRDPHRLHPRP